MRTISTITTAILIIGYSLSSFSQTADSLHFSRVIISTSALEYIPSLKLNTGNFNIGSEIFLKKNKSVYINAGVVKSYGPARGYFSIPSQNTKGYRIQFEGRHYLNKHRIFEPAVLLFWPHIFQYKSRALPNTGYYIALHSSFQFTTTERDETVIDYIDDKPYLNSIHYKQNVYSVDREVYGLSIKVGYQCVKRCGLTIDYSVGLGGIFISSNSRNRLGADTFDLSTNEDYPSKKLFDEGTGFAPNIVYQVRIGWGL